MVRFVSRKVNYLRPSLGFKELFDATQDLVMNLGWRKHLISLANRKLLSWSNLFKVCTANRKFFGCSICALYTRNLQFRESLGLIWNTFVFLDVEADQSTNTMLLVKP